MAAPSSTPVVVVAPRFCAPRTLPLTLAMKCKAGCTVTDASGAVILHKDGIPFFSFRRRHVMVDAAGLPVLTLHEKFGGLSWQVFRGDSNSASDLLFTATASSVHWPFRGLDVFLAGNNTRWRSADFKTMGNFTRSCYFYLGDSETMIASMNRMKSCGRPAFGVTVFPHVDHAFIAALVFISHYVSANIDERRQEDNRRREEYRRRQENR
ncbi:unnamed protein product [Urochloa humidicola]